MVRKGAKTVSTFVEMTTEDVGAIVMASGGQIKDNVVDPRKLIGTIHIKKYLADTNINGKVETWINIIKKLTAPLEEGQTREELTAEEIDVLEQCKKETALYLEKGASAALKTKVSESTDELKNLKDVASSMKYKFSKFAYETVAHVINLMVRELLVFTCGNCASQKAKLTKVAHIPWESLQSKFMAGMYMNTKAAFETVHPTTEPVVESDTAVEEGDASGEETPEVKATKPRLSQYISNTSKEIVSRDERFKGLLLGKEITVLVNDVVFQVLDRYANVIKSLLEPANSKIVNERLALIATKILLQGHIHASNDDIAVVLDVVQSRLDELNEQPEEEEEPPEEASA